MRELPRVERRQSGHPLCDIDRCARAVNDPTATNVVQVILSGVYRHAAGDTANIPAFGAAYSDYEIASDHAACVGTLSRIFTVIEAALEVDCPHLMATK
jgi:hypothetical protein